MTPDKARRSVTDSIVYHDSLLGMLAHHDHDLDLSQWNGWVALVRSGMLTDAISSRTPHLEKIAHLGDWVMHAAQEMLIRLMQEEYTVQLQNRLDALIDKTTQIKVLIDATPR